MGNKPYSHTIGIHPSNELSNLLTEINTEILSIYPEESRPYDSWKPHIDVLTIGVLPDSSNEYMKTIEEVSPGENFEMKIDRIDHSENGRYIFLKFSEDSNKGLMSLRQRYESTIKEVNTPIPVEYSEERMESFTKSQKERILRGESPYEFAPHLSVIKMSSREFGEKAMKIVMKYKEGLLDKTFLVNALYVGIETYDENGNVSFPEIDDHLHLTQSRKEPAE